MTVSEPTPESLAAKARLVRASDAWLAAEEAFEAAKVEYHAAFAALAKDGAPKDGDRDG